MANWRRLTISPPLTETEFAGFWDATPDLEIDRDSTGVITVAHKRKGRGNYGDWLLSPRGTVNSDINLDDDERLSIGAEVHHIAQDNENLQALEAQEGRLIREQETSECTSTRAVQAGGARRQNTSRRSLGSPSSNRQRVVG